MTERLKGAWRKALFALLLLAPGLLLASGTAGQEGARAEEPAAHGQWEYLVVAGASGTNLSASGNARLRKDPSGAFGREAFVLEQHLDKLGAAGWELVAVSGHPAEPVYYFKRRK